MPRQPKFNHPLRKIRIATGLSQPVFAALIGVSEATVQSIELGRLEMSNELAIKVQIQTGCSLTSTIRNNKTVLQVAPYAVTTLKPITHKDYEDHRATMQGFDDDLESHLRAAIQCLLLVLRAAHRKSGGTYLSIVKDFEYFVANAFESYRLAENLKELLKDNWSKSNVDLAVRSFPVAPLTTASPFQDHNFLNYSAQATGSESVNRRKTPNRPTPKK